MDLDGWPPDLLAAVEAMIPQIEGKPCVNVDADKKTVHACRRIGGLVIVEGVVQGMCEWVEPAEARPEELTDGLAIGWDCLEVGPGWWLDTYFNWYFVFDHSLVARSLEGDHSWVPTFLEQRSNS